MADWSDWYAREDPTSWVLPRSCGARAEEHPDRDYLRFGDGPWLLATARSTRAPTGSPTP